MLLAAGARPLFVCRQTGTSLEMIEKHYGDTRVDAEQLDEMIGGSSRQPGTFPEPSRMRATTRCRRRSRNPLCSTGFQRERATGVEPATSSLGSFLGPCGARVFRRR